MTLKILGTGLLAATMIAGAPDAGERRNRDQIDRMPPI